MEQRTETAIGRLVIHHGGPAAVSKLLGGSPVYQEVQRWVRRGWASPMQIFRLEPLLPDGMTVRDLYADREAATAERSRADAATPNKAAA